jgi:hypothetical protein
MFKHPFLNRLVRHMQIIHHTQNNEGIDEETRDNITFKQWGLCHEKCESLSDEEVWWLEDYALDESVWFIARTFCAWLLVEVLVARGLRDKIQESEFMSVTREHDVALEGFIEALSICECYEHLFVLSEHSNAGVREIVNQHMPHLSGSIN